MATSMLRAAAAAAVSKLQKGFGIFSTILPSIDVQQSSSSSSKLQKRAAIKVQLLGYPELHYHDHHQQQTTPNPPNNNNDSNSATTTTSNSPSSFMDLMEANFNTTTTTTTMNQLPPHHHLMGLTENSSPTFLSAGNPCIDFFYHIVPGTPPETLIQRLELAWKHDPLTTLKLICNLRGIRGTGKSDKEGFYAAALWLHKNHPKTLAGNVKWFANFGYFKDLPEILLRLLEGLDVRKKAEEERPRRGMNSRRMRIKMKRRGMAVDDVNKKTVKKLKREKKKSQETAKKLKREKIIEKGKKALERYYNDEDYRCLHDRISDMFAEYLISDLKLLNSGEVEKINQISLASKWCPNLDSSFDRATLLCESIARRVFPREEYPEYQGIEDAHYAYRVRDRLRKQYLVPLHQAIEIPEVYMSSNRWDSLPYNRVPSVAMKNYKSFFEKHDEERFKQYLEKVKSGETTIAAGALLPHEIIASLEYVSEYDDNNDKNDVAELQWRRMVKDLTEKGKLRDCLAICDVSGSMRGTPMEVCVALGLLVSEMNEDPWKGKVITFSQNPQLHEIEGEDLYSKTNFIRQMEWGMNTDFQKVFDLILQVAINGNLREDQMIKRLFVFSDMEFDQASSHSQNPQASSHSQNPQASYPQYGYPQYGYHSQNPQASYPQYGYPHPQYGYHSQNPQSSSYYQNPQPSYPQYGYHSQNPQSSSYSQNPQPSYPQYGYHSQNPQTSSYSQNPQPSYPQYGYHSQNPQASSHSQNPQPSYPQYDYPHSQTPQASFHSQDPYGYYPQYGYPHSQNPYGYYPQYGYPHSQNPYGYYPQYGYPHSQNPYSYYPQYGYPHSQNLYGYYPQYGYPPFHPHSQNHYGYYPQHGSGDYQNQNNNWETNYEAIKRKYQENGYGNSVPQIVFWNLRDSKATPVMGEQKGVALVSGFSKNLLTLFLDDMVENMTPAHVMEMAISGKEYQQLVVLD